MPDPTRLPPLPLSVTDVPGGMGPEKLVRTDDLAQPGNAPSTPVSGAEMSGYDDTLALPPLGAFNVQRAIDVLKGLTTGSVAIKAPCRVGTTPTSGNVALVGGAPNVLDGVALAAGDRILVKDQALPAENGIYVVAVLGSGADGTWTRAADFDSGAEVTGTTLVGVQEGNPYPTGNADTFWFVTTDGIIVIGVTPIVWALYPTAGIVTLNNRLWRDPTSNTAPIYVRVGGNDTNNGASPATAFATVSRAIQETVWASDYLGVFARMIDVGPGAFPVSDSILGTGSFRLFGSKTLVSSWTIAAATPPVNPIVGNTLVLDATGQPPVAAGDLIGQLIHFPSIDVWARIYRNDATVPGIPDTVTVCVVTESTTPNDVPGAGASVDFYTIDTTFEVPDSGCWFSGGSHYYASSFYYIKWVPAPGSTGFDAIDTIGALVQFVRSDISTTYVYNGAGSEHILFTCWLKTSVWQYEPNSSFEFMGGNVLDGLLLPAGQPQCWGPGSFTATFENAAVRLAGAVPVFAMAGGQFYSDQQAFLAGPLPNFSTLRLDGVPSAFHANYAVDFTIGQGGEYRLPSFLPPYNIGGVQIPGTVTGALVDVNEDSHADVSLGANSSMLIGGFINPVKIGSFLRSTDVSGTRITGGFPSPGPAGFAYRLFDPIAPGGTTWDPLTDNALEVDTTVATRDVALPAANSVTRGCRAPVKKRVTANDLTATPNLLDTIDGVAGPLSYNATFGPLNQGAIEFVSDGVSNWARF